MSARGQARARAEAQAARARDRWHLPPLGHRITKTTVAVFLCLIIYWLRGFSGSDMPTESAITAIICMQPYVRDSRTYAFNRFTGSLIGALWGLALLALLAALPAPGLHPACLYGLMALGVMLSLYSAVLVHMPDTCAQAAIVFLCVVITFPEVDRPLVQAGYRLLDVSIGTAAAIGVNLFRLPRVKHRERVFFLRTADLTPDRFTHMPPAALFRLNALYSDGARICLMSEHAPAFFALQMSAARVTTPLIVMDGAAIYDPNVNQYLSAETLPTEDFEAVCRRLEALNVSYFIYTVHRHKTCIFHRGAFRPEELIIYRRMRGSPYRSYLEEELYDPAEVVYIKIIVREENVRDLAYQLRGSLPKGRLRGVSRPQAGAEGIAALYIYSHTATMEQARKRLMAMLRKSDDTLVPVTLPAPAPYRSERDAVHLLHRLTALYEPVRLPWADRSDGRALPPDTPESPEAAPEPPPGEDPRDTT